MSVLSFRKSVDQLDLAAERNALMQKTLARVIDTTGPHTVELNSEKLRTFRTNMGQLRDRAETVTDAAGAEQLHADFRNELRHYAEATQGEVRRLRGEMSDVVASIQSFLAESVRSGTNHHQVLQREFKNLNDVAQAGNLTAIRGAVRRATETAFRSYEEIQRAQDTVIAQLQDEIRHLHEQVGQERKAALSDPGTGLWGRSKLDGRITELLLLNEGFCVFLIGAPRLLQISRRDPRLGPALLRALAGRLQNASGANGENGMAGRWSAEVFAVIFNLPLASAPASAAELRAQLSGDYAIQLEGVTTNLVVDVSVQAVERQQDTPEAAFYQALGSTAFQVVTVS